MFINKIAMKINTFNNWMNILKIKYLRLMNNIFNQMNTRLVKQITSRTSINKNSIKLVKNKFNLDKICNFKMNLIMNSCRTLKNKWKFIILINSQMERKSESSNNNKMRYIKINLIINL